MAAHCESCGRENPGTDEGYTGCCNELVCYGQEVHTFGTQARNVRSCCWAKAEAKFGGWANVPEGSSRLS